MRRAIILLPLLALLVSACGGGSKTTDKPKRVSFVERMCGDPKPDTVDGCTVAKIVDGKAADGTAATLDRLTSEIATANSSDPDAKLTSTCVPAGASGLYQCSGMFVNENSLPQTSGISSFYVGLDKEGRAHAPIDAASYLLGSIEYTS